MYINVMWYNFLYIFPERISGRMRVQRNFRESLLQPVLFGKILGSRTYFLRGNFQEQYTAQSRNKKKQYVGQTLIVHVCPSATRGSREYSEFGEPINRDANEYQPSWFASPSAMSTSGTPLQTPQ